MLNQDLKFSVILIQYQATKKSLIAETKTRTSEVWKRFHVWVLTHLTHANVQNLTHANVQIYLSDDLPVREVNVWKGNTSLEI